MIDKGYISYSYRWRECQDIIDWIYENMKYIFSDDRFPLYVFADSSAEKCQKSFDLDFDDIEQHEILHEWMFRNSWFSVRVGSYLADVFFVKNGDKIEILWDNTSTFTEDGIRFIFPKGKYEVDIKTFEKIMDRMRCMPSAHPVRVLRGMHRILTISPFPT